MDDQLKNLRNSNAVRSLRRVAYREISREEIRDMEQAHAEGLHDDLPREFCPECEDRKGRC